MKALTYNPEKEIMTALAVLFFSIAMMAKANGQGPLSHLTMFPDTFESDAEESSVSKPTAADLVEYEPATQIENWMLNNSYWGNPASAEIIEPERELQIEKWMTNANYWGVNNVSEYTEADNPLKIEKWMTTNLHFGYHDQYTETDNEQKIETWMNSSTYWTGAVQNQIPENLVKK